MAKFIGYLPVGFPTFDESMKGFYALIDAGTDIIEVGVAYSDPVMDGSTIQEATKIALDNGFKLGQLFQAVEQIKKYSYGRYSDGTIGKPVQIYVMCYYNMAYHYGLDKFAKQLAISGAIGVIIPDLTPDEAGEWKKAANEYSLHTVFLTAPNSTDQRLKTVAKNSTGFVYASSLLGTTGTYENDAQFADVQETVSKVRQSLIANGMDTPIYVGLGVSSAEQAKQVARYADGVIVGSKLVQALKNGVDELKYVATTIADACHVGQF